MICPNCGHENSASRRTCKDCRSPLTVNAPQAPDRDPALGPASSSDSDFGAPVYPTSQPQPRRGGGLRSLVVGCLVVGLLGFLGLMVLVMIGTSRSAPPPAAATPTALAAAPAAPTLA